MGKEIKINAKLASEIGLEKSILLDYLFDCYKRTNVDNKNDFYVFLHFNDLKTYLSFFSEFRIRKDMQFLLVNNFIDYRYDRSMDSTYLYTITEKCNKIYTK